MKKILSICVLAAISAVMALAADVSGKWSGDNGRGGTVTFTLKQDGEKLTGSTTGRGGEIEISNGSVKGDTVYFEVTRDMGEKGKFTTKYTGKLDGSSLKVSMDNGRGNPREMTLTKQ